MTTRNRGDCGYGGEGWIRTSVRLRGQIYSLLPLTTRPPLHEELHAQTIPGRVEHGGQARHMAARHCCVNASVPPACLATRDCKVVLQMGASKMPRRWPD